MMVNKSYLEKIALYEEHKDKDYLPFPSSLDRIKIEGE